MWCPDGSCVVRPAIRPISSAQNSQEVITMQAQVTNQTKAASRTTLSPRSRWESVPASHRANPSQAVLNQTISTALHRDKGVRQIKQKAQIRPGGQGTWANHLVLPGSRSQQATAQTKAKQRSESRRKHAELSLPRQRCQIADRGSTP